MGKTGLLLALAAALLAVPASGKRHQPKNYQAGVLVDFATHPRGMYCSGSGSVNGEADDSGDVTGTTYTDSNCVPRETTYYTVDVDNHRYVLRPEATGKQRGIAAATLGYSRFFTKRSTLYHHLPGTKILVRSDNHGYFWVKVGKRESKYEVISAH